MRGMARLGRALSGIAGSDVLRRFQRNRPAMIGLGMVALLAIFAIAGPWVIPHDPNASDFSLARDAMGAPPGPSSAHLLGTDALFRDLLARLAYGARISLLVALSATVMSTTVGALVGVAAGLTAGGRFALVDAALMRAVDVLLALPFLLFVTAIGVAVGSADIGTVLLVLGLTSWAGTARLIRAKTMQVRELDFVTAARALGAGPRRIIGSHILPNVAGTLVVVATMSVAQMILAESVLSYLGMGVAPPRATWGRMLQESQHFLDIRPGLVAVPGFAILFAALAWSRVGDGLRDAMDPKSAASLPPSRRLPFDLLMAVAAALVFAIAPARRAALNPPIGSEPPVDRPVRGGILRVATHVNVRTLDPAIAYDEAATPIEELLFARLVTWDSEGRVVPDLAREVTTSTDGRTVTFVLRDGLRFHDGSELSARDVKRSIERSLHPKTPCPAASYYAMIEGFEAFHAGRAAELTGVRAVGDRTIAINLTGPDATFLPLMTLAFMAPVCPSAGAHVESQSPARPCGAGPFRLDAWNPDESLRLVRHEGYYKPGLPYLDAIEWATRVPASTQRFKLEEGQLDYIRDLTGTDTALFTADPAWSQRGRWFTKPTTNALFLNTELAPFNDRAMRRAVAFAVDPSVLPKIKLDVAETDRVLPVSVPGPDRSAPMRRHDPALALAEMARAGYAFDPVTRKGGYPREIELLTIAGTFEQQVAEVVQQQLARVGIRIRLRLVSFATYLTEVARRRTAVMGTTGWNADYPDAANFFEPNLSSKAIQDEGSQNYAFLSNAELDRVLDLAHTEQDTARRLDLYAKAEAIVRDEAPWIPMYSVRILELWQPYVRGYRRHPVLQQQFSEVWLDPAARSTAAFATNNRPPALAWIPFGGPDRRAAPGRLRGTRSWGTR